MNTHCEDDAALYALVLTAFDVISAAGRPLTASGAAALAARAFPAADAEMLRLIQAAAAELLQRVLH